MTEAVPCPACQRPLPEGTRFCPDCGSQTLTMPSAPDIPGYRFVRFLGRGGMALVYLYEDTELRRSVAVKVISQTEGDAHDRERFEREARVMASIAHPNVVHIFSFGRSGDQPYIIMEFVDRRKTLYDVA